MSLSVGAGDAVTLSSLWLLPAPGEYPNATSVNFGDQLELVGFELVPRRVAPGETMNLTLYWRARQALSMDYTFFAQVVDQDTTRWASYDMPPDGGTAAWKSGDVYRVDLPLQLSPETPPSVYPIHLGMYTRDSDGTFRRLQVVADDGRITQDNFLLLTRIRVD